MIDILFKISFFFCLSFFFFSRKKHKNLLLISANFRVALFVYLSNFFHDTRSFALYEFISGKICSSRSSRKDLVPSFCVHPLLLRSMDSSKMHDRRKSMILQRSMPFPQLIMRNVIYITMKYSIKNYF